MPELPKNTASRISHGPGWVRKRNCPLMPASLIGSMDGTHEITTTIVISAQAARIANASRQDIASASNVPAGTPSMLATVWPITIMDTDCASLPLSASVLAISVAVPKNAPCGRPEMKRATSSIGEQETALSVLPTNAMAMNRMMRCFGGTLRPNTRISVPTHTPMAYAEM